MTVASSPFDTPAALADDYGRAFLLIAVMLMAVAAVALILLKQRAGSHKAARR